MSKELLEVFIDGITRYFQHTAHKKVEIGTPYLVNNNNPVIYDHTGFIGITGSMKGCVYFTAPVPLLEQLLLSMGETNTSKDNIMGAVGEVANTISGNARKQLGEGFMISVPIIISGQPSDIHLPKEALSYVIPIKWKGHNSAVVFCFTEQTEN
jgi:chemotaxis protein CheX